MAQLDGRPGWVSLPEAARIAGISLPALRYLVRRLALVLGAAQDERGDTYLPEERLGALQRAVSLRAQGRPLPEIERLLAAGPAAGAREVASPEPGPAHPAGSPSPAAPVRSAPEDEKLAPMEVPSLPFPLRPSLRAPGGRRSRSQAHASRYELPFPGEDLRRDLEALRQENQELRLRIEELVGWLQRQQRAPAGEPGAPAGPVSEAGPAAAADAIPAAAARLPEGTQLTRTPSGNLRPAVVRSWKPPALNGRH